MNMLFSKRHTAQKITIVLKIDFKKWILLSKFYYKVGKDKGSIFFQSLCEVAILHFAFLYFWAEKMSTSFLTCKASHETK